MRQAENPFQQCRMTVAICSFSCANDTKNMTNVCRCHSKREKLTKTFKKYCTMREEKQKCQWSRKILYISIRSG